MKDDGARFLLVNDVRTRAAQVRRIRDLAGIPED